MIGPGAHDLFNDSFFKFLASSHTGCGNLKSVYCGGVFNDFTSATIDTLVTDCTAPFEVSIGKNHALKKYDQFALNTGCFWEFCMTYYARCAISLKSSYKFREIAQL